DPPPRAHVPQAPAIFERARVVVTPSSIARSVTKALRSAPPHDGGVHPFTCAQRRRCFEGAKAHPRASRVRRSSAQGAKMRTVLRILLALAALFCVIALDSSAHALHTEKLTDAEIKAMSKR